MKFGLVTFLALVVSHSNAWSQDRIYRCGNEYTNTVSDEQAKHCKLVSGGNVSVVQAHRPAPSTSAKSSSTGSGGPRVDSTDQRSKDSDARMILESELKKAETRQTELQREYNNGEPEKLGPETRNNQKYLDRVAELKSSMSRNESDIAGIRRELGRVPAASANSALRN